MTATLDYTPPPSTTIKARQNEPEALRLLVAQRRLHSNAKTWQGVRWAGLLLIALAAPVFSVIWQGMAVPMGALAGAWLFLGRTVLVWLAALSTSRAAATQELFDHFVFAMPSSLARSTTPSIEDIARHAGPDDKLIEVAQSKKLIDWYPVNESLDGGVSVAIAQRANASYSDRLLRVTAWSWGIATTVWVVVLVIWSMAAGLSAAIFLAGVALPVLPALLDIFEYVQSIARAARDRGDLARSIQEQIETSSTNGIDPQDLLVWQSEMYDLRRSTPPVPDLVYKLTRDRNEAAMNSAAAQLGRRASGEN